MAVYKGRVCSNGPYWCQGALANMTLTKACVLFVLFLVVAKSVGGEPEIPPGDEVIPFDEDQRNGETYERARENQENVNKQLQEEQNGGSSETEAEIQGKEDLYLEWIQDYHDSGVMPEINEEVQSFMDENGINIEDIKNQYERSKLQRSHSRQKRSYLLSDSGIWTKCVIPYFYDSSISESTKVEMEKVHSYFEKYTGFRFVKWEENKTRIDYDLDHDNYVIYTAASGCWSYVGNLGGNNGQRLSPCGGGGVAIHEIGHMLGMMHEQKNPQSFAYTRVEYDYIKPDYRSQYDRSDITHLYNPEGFYDISSRMHYGRWYFGQNYGGTMNANDPSYSYIIDSGNDYYMFKEIQEYHKCYDEYDSCQERPVCENGGYVSVIEGKCQCYCPPELDPSTNCTTKFGTNQSLKDLSWPDGTYTLLKTTESDCPSGWENGTMVHWPVSHIWNSDTYHHSPPLSSYELGHDVCTKTEAIESSTDKAVWSPGQYCILRYGGTCPEGFEVGYQDTYGPVKRNDTNVGTLPDGNHDYPFEYIYCCRTDGSKNDPIKLPTSEPFILYLESYWGCQQVEDMLFYTEYYNFISNSSEVINETGALPYMYNFNSHRKNIYFCFYKPISKDCGMVKQFSAGETTFTFTSPGYPNNYDNALMCYWHFQSPKGTKMYMNFNDFEVSAAESSSCDDHVEISFTEPSIGGFSVCGHGYKKTTWTWDNFLSLKFVSRLGDTYKGFNATITVYADDEVCYNGDGSDGSYAGDVNYTKTFAPCIPWHKAEKCLFYQFDSKVVDWRLTGNSCRNVGYGTQPWCYINAETCERQDCDACMWGSCYDIFLDCEDSITNDPDYCTNNDEAERGCKKTCGFCDQRVRKGRVNCEAPPEVIGAETYYNLEVLDRSVQTSFDIGDVVTYACTTSNDVRSSTCTSEGRWTEVNFVCESCPTGYAVFNQRCFKWLGYEVRVYYETAVAMCNETSSILAKIDSPEVATFMQKLVEYSEYDNTGVWLGIKADLERNWFWGDGTPLSGWTNWESGQPNNWGNGQYCGEFQIDKKWGDISCENKKAVVCEHQIDKSGHCEDQLTYCESLLMANPDMCTDHSVFATHMCKSTCRLAGCNTDITCADDTQPENYANIINGTSSQVVSISECNQGYIVKSGDATRVCSTSGNWSGSNLVCEDAEVCNDFLDNCGDIWSQNPKMCEESPAYADRNCRGTCGVGACSSGNTCSDAESLQPFVTRVHGTDSINVGQYYEYSCQSGMLKKSGDHIRVCQSDGSLSGSALTCSSLITCEDNITNCEQILTETPELCVLYTDFAWKNCIRTCGFEACLDETFSTNNCTDDTNPGVGAVRLKGAEQIKIGDYVEYQCSDGYIKTAGNTKRACLPTGVLSGIPITCIPVVGCDSDLPECEAMLSENPKLCQDSLQFAWHSCRKTCGFEATVTCVDDYLSTMATRTAGSDIMKPGQYLEHECNEGYMRESGDFVRLCQPSGTLTGSPLSCSISSAVNNCDDLLTDCALKLEANPALCEVLPDYASHFCRNSCGVEECQTNITCDATPTFSEVVNKTSGSDQLNAGQYAVYECSAPYLRDSGSFKRTCLPSGQLTGAEPMCTLNYEESTTSLVCEDQHSGCETDLQETPDMCVKHPDYAWQNCRKTCGVGDCRPQTTCTDDTNLGYRATRTVGSGEIFVGQYIQYECNEGYFAVSGSPTRACLPNGQLTDTSLICLHKDVTTNVDLFTQKEIFKRPTTSSSYQRCLVANVTDMRFTVAGNVTSWTYFSNYGNEIAFQIWRLNEESPLSFTLIGQNIITDSPNERKRIYRVPINDQIYAEVGDLIGIYQKQDEELSFTRCDESFQPENAPWYETSTTNSHAAEYNVGMEHSFQENSKNCRIYSVRASVNPSACTDDDTSF